MDPESFPIVDPSKLSFGWKKRMKKKDFHLPFWYWPFEEEFRDFGQFDINPGEKSATLNLVIFEILSALFVRRRRILQHLLDPMMKVRGVLCKESFYPNDIHQLLILCFTTNVSYNPVMVRSNHFAERLKSRSIPKIQELWCVHNRFVLKLNK